MFTIKSYDFGVNWAVRERVAFAGEEAIDVKVPAKDKFQFKEVAPPKHLQPTILSPPIAHALITINHQNLVMVVNRPIQHRPNNWSRFLLNGPPSKELATQEIRHKDLLQKATLRRWSQTQPITLNLNPLRNQPPQPSEILWNHPHRGECLYSYGVVIMCVDCAVYENLTVKKVIIDSVEGCVEASVCSIYVSAWKGDCA